MVFYIHDQGSRVHTPADALFRPAGVAPLAASQRARRVEAHEEEVVEALETYEQAQKPPARRPALNAADVMTAPAQYARADWPLRRAWLAFERNQIHHLPVLGADQALVGIVSDRDLLRAGALEAGNRDKSLSTVMTRRVVSCLPNANLHVLAEVMVGQRIGALPVVDEAGALVGIVSRSDILKSLIREAPLEAWV